jgi:hypothetical protein
MEESFLVEFRLRGYARKYAEWASGYFGEIGHLFGMKTAGCVVVKEKCQSNC